MSSHALITGGSSGIGLALAARLAASGSNITIIARKPEGLAAAKAAIGAKRRERAQSVLALAADVTDEAAVTAAIQSAIGTLGPPDLLVTSAGMVIPGLFHDMPVAAFRSTMEANYFGTLYAIRAVLPAMRTNRAGRIALISSGAGLLGIYGLTAYSPTKFAVRGLAEALRSELAPDGIAVSVVYPPDTDTPQLHEEVRHRPPALAKIAGGAKVLSADAVAAAILNGIARKRFIIAPGLEMAALARLHSLIGPLLYRFW
ncbi:MAG TPA: SDR family oxidoreductase, partial [Burkholderiales bacterium]|nr:SDR family oxidoreductase [Burkholderiales bacterium]